MRLPFEIERPTHHPLDTTPNPRNHTHTNNRRQAWTYNSNRQVSFSTSRSP
jgi:hypothetical protein